MSMVFKQLLKNYLFLLIYLLFSLIIISCSSVDDSALKDGKIAANLSEADQFEPPYISTLTINEIESDELLEILPVASLNQTNTVRE